MTSSNPSSSSVTNSVPFTSPVPPALFAATPIKDNVRSAAVPADMSPIKKTSTIPARPPVTPLAGPPPPASVSAAAASSSSNRPQARDRRAFSFPATQAVDPIPFNISAKRRARESQGILPPFIRKTQGFNYNNTQSPNHRSQDSVPTATSGATSASSTLPNHSYKTSGTLKVPMLNRETKSTGGANTPFDPESVFCSTSESETEDRLDQAAHPSPLRLLGVASTTTPDTSTVPSSAALSRKSTSKSGKPLTSSKKEAERPSSSTLKAHQRRDFAMARTNSHSPVATLIASSASSRSREDIISWAKAIELRPSGSAFGEDSASDHEGAEEEDRGRSRTRRPSAALPVASPSRRGSTLPPTMEEADNETAHSGGDTYSTTPKGRMGWSGLGIGPIVKALTKTIAPSPAPAKRTLSDETIPVVNAGLGLQSVLAPAEISRIAVVSTSGGMSIPAPQSTHANDSDIPMYFGGATPTLSTVSFSEVVDPSINGTHDAVDIVTTDDNFSTTSYNQRRAPPSSRSQGKGKPSVNTSSVSGNRTTSTPGPNRQPPLPLRPIASTATAIWNLSTYLRSFSPFSIASVIPPYVPFAAAAAGLAKGSDTTVQSAPSVDRSQRQGVDDPCTPPEPRSPDLDLETATNSPNRLKHGVSSVEAQSSAPLPLVASKVNLYHGEGQDETPETAQQTMVRSLPMDIVLPSASGFQAIQANEERVREREAREYLERSQSRHRSTSRSRRVVQNSNCSSWIPNDKPHYYGPYDNSLEGDFDDGYPLYSNASYLSRQPHVIAPASQASQGKRPERPASSRKRQPSHTHKISYDADHSDDGDDEDRGRSRRGKVLPRDSAALVVNEQTATATRPGVPRRLSEGGMQLLGQRSKSKSTDVDDDESRGRGRGRAR